MKKKGFTLTELVVVVALLGILAIVFAPRLRDNLAKAKDAKVISLLGALREASEAYYADTGTYPYGNGVPSVVNDFNAVNNPDKPGLNLIMSGLNNEAKRMFGSGYTVDVGGVRESKDGSISYKEKIGYTFHAPVGATADGIMVWFTERAIGTTDGRYDTKGARWTSY